ncbi:hypothetical protein BD311DRAFT_479441 [Dichomitus squalens]|uniref:Uncharacterized protein n=1 Tax=Dichomitus squalens TaxID=114155 RepID=A0A4Q9N2L5_9APHY|nr:hypothetical protein BD311DRAFT_479441 [Dichomitus squalens]
MFIRVISRGLFKRGSQVDLGGRPPREKKNSNEDTKLLQQLTSDPGDEQPLESMPEITAGASSKQTARPDVGDKTQPVTPEVPERQTDNNHHVREDSSKAHKPEQRQSEASSPLIVVNASGAGIKTEEAEDADEVFQTPLSQTPHLGLPGEASSSVTPPGIERFLNVPGLLKTSPCMPPGVLAMDSQPTQGMLSDITEAEEPSVRDSFVQDATPSPDLLSGRTLSCSSFGSSYPSSPELRDVKTTYQVLETSASISAAQSEFREAERSPGRPPYPVALQPDFVPFVVAPLLSSSSVNRPGKREAGHDYDGGCERGPKDEGDDEPKVEHNGEYKADSHPASFATTGLCPSASTYADATNLALQHPEIAADILRQPLSSASTSSRPSNCPTPSESCITTLNTPPASGRCSPNPKKANLPHTSVRPNWALASDIHTPDRPNWAVAPKAGRQARSRGRGKGRRGTSVSAAVSGTEQSICADTLPATSCAATGSRDGPQQWLTRVNSWMEQTPRAVKIPTTTLMPEKGLQTTSRPFPAEPMSQWGRHSRSSTSVLNPRAPTWSPPTRVRRLSVSETESEGPTAESRSSPSANSVRRPLTFAVDADIDRLRDMLRSCGIQDDETVATSNLSMTLKPSSMGSKQVDDVAIAEKEAQKTPAQRSSCQEKSTQGASDEPNILYHAGPAPRRFEYKTSTRFVPYSSQNRSFGRPSQPQRFFAEPGPRCPPLNGVNARDFGKEPARPRMAGPFEPNTPPGAPVFTQSSAARYSGSAFFSTPPPQPAPPQSHSFSRTLQVESGSSHAHDADSPSMFVPGAYKVRFDCTERRQDAPVSSSHVSPTASVDRPRQPSGRKGSRFA